MFYTVGSNPTVSTFKMSLEKNTIYFCEVWSSSIDLKSLKSCLLLLPLPRPCTGLSTKIKRFTLLRSPLGNKKSKDQFERREYRSYFFFQSNKACQILKILDLLKLSSGIKFKIAIKRLY